MSNCAPLLAPIPLPRALLSPHSLRTPLPPPPPPPPSSLPDDDFLRCLRAAFPVFEESGALLPPPFPELPSTTFVERLQDNGFGPLAFFFNLF